MAGRGKRFWHRLAVTTSCLLGLAAIAALWGFQTLLTWKLWREAGRNPILALTPKPLTIANPSSTDGMVLSHAGFRFEVPWADYDSQRSKHFERNEVYAFRSGSAVMLFGPTSSRDGLMSTVEKNFGGSNALMLFGPEATGSEYAFHKTILELTPAAMKPWMSQREAVRTSMLLTIKAISSVGGETGLFSVEANDWKGFQFDDPGKKPRKITLEIYDSQDHHFEFLFLQGTGAGASVTQADINRVLLTLRPIELPAKDSPSTN